ncbi:MAG: STAS domain-containing protein [Candidatus Cybelea sp.]
MDVVGHLDTLTDKTQTETHVAPTTRGTQAENVLQRVVMIFGGEYDLACKEHLRADLERLANVQDVVLDFTDVTYIDSTVVVELIRINQIRSSKGYKRETIVLQNPNIKRLFTLLSLQDVFHFVPELNHVVDKNEQPIGLDYASCARHVS